ncbi:MAG: GNAT family N-acetyltransferase [Duncaniella sp.]|nr:GNAT family N-acetyltransferase [Duncaniella sp.]
MQPLSTIRPVTPADYAKITEIYNHYVTKTVISFETAPLTVEEMASRIEHISSCHPYLVSINAKGEVEGYCYAHPWKERAAYAGTLESTVYLHPSNTGSGIGARLMEALIKECRSRGVDNLIACITYGNHASCHMHERLGFTRVSHFRRVGRKFGIMLDVVDYQLSLL